MLISQKEARDMLDELEKVSGHLPEWQADFVDSLQHWVGEGKKLTPKQLETLNNIWERV